MGLSSGLIHLPSKVFSRPRPMNAALADRLRTGEAEIIVSGRRTSRAGLLLFRHPKIFTAAALPRVEAERVVLAINHPPISAFGPEPEYDLLAIASRLERTYGMPPALAPIGPAIRDRLLQRWGDAIRLTPEDWVNVFDLDRFDVHRDPPRGGVLRIGRHSRPGREKWPDSREAILASYPDRADTPVNVLGGIDPILPILEGLPRHWTVHPFGAMDPADFLRGIDVFVYQHHPGWTEAFGRVVIEAMASGLPVVVPPYMRALVGDAGICAEPEEVGARLETLREPETWRLWSGRARRFARDGFGDDVHRRRLARLGIG